MRFLQVIMTRSLLVGAVIVATLGSVSLAHAQPAPPGWGGPHYYWHGHHWHHRGWGYGPHHRRYRRYW